MQEEGHREPADVRHEGVQEAATHCLLVALAQEPLSAVGALVPVKTLASGEHDTNRTTTVATTTIIHNTPLIHCKQP